MRTRAIVHPLWSLTIAILSVQPLHCMLAAQTENASYSLTSEPGFVSPFVISAAFTDSTSVLSATTGAPVLSLAPSSQNNSPDAPRSVVGGLNAAACGLAGAPTWCAGSDIGAWVNAAVAALSGPSGGEILIPQGVYKQTTTIVLRRDVTLRGSSAYPTVLQWNAAGTGCSTGPCPWAVVVSDSTGHTKYPEGAIEDITFNGPGAPSNAGAIFIGGDPGGISGPGTNLSPSGNFGDHFSFNRVRITNFGLGVEWGNNAWANSFFESLFVGNGTGIVFPLGITNSGESISILTSSVANNLLGMNLQGFGEFYLAGSRCDYNTARGCADIGKSAAVFFHGTHFEQRSGTILNIAASADTRLHVSIVGGWMGLINTAPESRMINVSSGANATLLVDGLFTYNVLPVTNFVNWSAAGGVLSLTDVHVNTPGFTGGLTTGCPSGGCYVSNGGTVAFSKLNQNASGQLGGISACVGNTKSISFPVPYLSQPIILLFDETTQGGIKLKARNPSGFTALCTGATDAFDWLVIGNPN